MVRDRVVADDWLVSIEGNRYSVPFALIGKTVQVVREGGQWVIRHRGARGGRARGAGRPRRSSACSPSTGPGAAARNARSATRLAGSRRATMQPRAGGARPGRVRELLGVQLLEAVA